MNFRAFFKKSECDFQLSMIFTGSSDYKRRFWAIFFISRLTNYSLRVLFFGSSHASKSADLSSVFNAFGPLYCAQFFSSCTLYWKSTTLNFQAFFKKSECDFQLSMIFTGSSDSMLLGRCIARSFSLVARFIGSQQSTKSFK